MFVTQNIQVFVTHNMQAFVTHNINAHLSDLTTLLADNAKHQSRGSNSVFKNKKILVKVT